jgi:hypothetical protein
VSDLYRVRVEPASGPDELTGGGLHWFRVEFDNREGRCFITTGEALHLRQLTSDWVRRALLNLAVKNGHRWVESAVCSSPGLMLHHHDASEPSERRPVRAERLDGGRSEEPWL